MPDSPEIAPEPPASSAERLVTPLEQIRAVGRDRAHLMGKLKLRTVRDALFFFPREYQDYRDLKPIARLEADIPVSVRGRVAEVSERTTSRGVRMLGVLLTDGTHALRAVWFNQPFLRPKFQNGQELILSGKAKLRGMRWEMPHPRVQWIDVDEEPPAGNIMPVYRLTEGVTQGHVRYMLRTVLADYAPAVEEVFPPDFLAAHRLLPIGEAIPNMHFPRDPETLAAARRRFVYQELFVLQLGLALRRQAMLVQWHSSPLERTAKIDARIRRLFPFELTAGQNAAIEEIVADMSRTIPMNRLLQGDVGSGKTVVALYAILLAVANGHQAALMAPTEVLARQHARVLGRMLEQSHVRTALLTGGMAVREKTDALAAIASGETQVVIGTQAILGSAVEFSKLGLVVIDEQHKFGVRQRSGLKKAGQNPHYLVMTATPIPRTVSMTLYGDLDVSTLKESAAGPAKPLHLHRAGRQARQVVGVRSQEITRRTTGVCGRSPG
ncbi:MAG: DEAD/DEAH box helicase [Pirellulales bacterium]